MSARWGVPAPEGIRHVLRAPYHPARSVECPHCGAHPHAPCMTRPKRRRLPQPHPARINAWVRDVVACPDCGADRGLDCHDGAWNLPEPHPVRVTVATESAS